MKEERLMKVRKIVASLAALSMLAAFPAQAVLAADTVAIKADKVEVAAGENFTLNVSLDGVPTQGISVIEFAVKYDASVVSDIKVAAGEVAQNGVDSVEKFEGASAFMADTSTSGLITITYSTAQSDAKYCISKSGAYAVITGTVKSGTAAKEYPVEIVAIDRETKQGSGTTNKDIKAGYIDADNNATYYDTTVTAGAIVVTDGTTPTEGGDIVWGDVDENGKVNILDVIALNKHLMINAEIGTQGKLNADVNKSGKPDSTDALNILKYIVKLVELPVK
jgi:uncharacterized protein YuzE